MGRGRRRRRRLAERIRILLRRFGGSPQGEQTTRHVLHQTARLVAALRVMGTTPMTEPEHRFRELTEPEKRQFASLPLNEQYATFCGLGDEDDFTERYELGLRDFERLLQLRGIEEVGLNWDKRLLLIGTEEIIVLMVDEKGKPVLKRLGQYVISINEHRWYSIANISRNVNNYAHPHSAQDSSLCMTDTQIIRLALADGKPSEAIEIILAALRMDESVIVRGIAYCSLGNWPSVED